MSFSDLKSKVLQELSQSESKVHGLKWSVDVRSSSHDVSRSLKYETEWDPDPRESRALKTASVGKIFLLAYLASLFDESQTREDAVTDRKESSPRLSLWDNLPVLESRDAIVGDSGMWHLLCSAASGTSYRPLCVRDACVLVGAASDNAATNLLLHYVGSRAMCATNDCVHDSSLYTEVAVKAISDLNCRVFRQLGFQDCHSFLFDQVRDERDPAKHAETLSRGRSHELRRFVEECHARACDISQTHGLRFLSFLPQWLQNNVDLSMVASAFQLDPLAHQSYTHDVRALGPKGAPKAVTPLPANGVAHFFNKTGTDDGVRADVGVIEFQSDGNGIPNEVVSYSVICNWDATIAGARELSVVLRCMRSIGEFIAKGNAQSLCEE